MKRRILLGAYSLSAGAKDNYFIQAQKARRLVQDEFDKVFSLPNPLRKSIASFKPMGEGKVDVILAPTAQSLPPKFSDLEGTHATDTYSADVLTVPASLAGLPAISVPVRISAKYTNPTSSLRTVGMQVIGQYNSDPMVLAVATHINTTQVLMDEDSENNVKGLRIRRH